MNTGIGDAVNLSWKIAEVLHGRADASLLNTYESERIPFAQSLIATTDRVWPGFWSMTAKPLNSPAYNYFPRTVGTLAKVPAVRKRMFKTVSQTRITYKSALSTTARPALSTAATVCRGSRTATTTTSPALRLLTWQLHVYGQPDTALVRTAGGLGLPSSSVYLQRRCPGAAYRRMPPTQCARTVMWHWPYNKSDQSGRQSAFVKSRGLRLVPSGTPSKGESPCPGACCLMRCTAQVGHRGDTPPPAGTSPREGPHASSPDIPMSVVNRNQRPPLSCPAWLAGDRWTFTPHRRGSATRRPAYLERVSMHK